MGTRVYTSLERLARPGLTVVTAVTRGCCEVLSGLDGHLHVSGGPAALKPGTSVARVIVCDQGKLIVASFAERSRGRRLSPERLAFFTALKLLDIGPNLAERDRSRTSVFDPPQ
jgi:hypothetical protein